jgi:O-antigen ligase
VNWAPVIAATYLMLCLVLGGSAQGIWSNLVIQLAGLAILGWTLMAPGQVLQTKDLRRLHWLLAIGVGWCLFQLIPLPPIVWTQLGDRTLISDGFRLTGERLPWLPISMQPSAAIGCLLALIPGLAVGELLLRRRDVQAETMAMVVLLVTFAGILLGIMQVRGGDTFQLYRYFNHGLPTGFFANSNHMAIATLIAVPFLFALAAHRGIGFGRWMERPAFLVILLLACATLLLGVVTNGSFAILLLGPPVLLASSLLFIPSGTIRIARLIILTGLLAVGGAVVLLVSAEGGFSSGNLASVAIRHSIWDNVAGLIGRFGWFGTGLGSFDTIYPLSEATTEVSRFYVNHAHNDYLELIMELGFPGLILIIAFLAWWLRRTVKLWRTREPVHFARAATIASGTLILHSLVDYPLRTGALVAIFGLCLALMLIGSRAWRSADRAPSPARHLTLDDVG